MANLGTASGYATVFPAAHHWWCAVDRPDTSTGTWIRSGNAFTFNDPADPAQPVAAGTLSGRDLTLTAALPDFNRTVVAVFRK